MRKSATFDERLSNLVNSLAKALSITPDVVAVLQRCASLLDYEVQDDGNVRSMGSNTGKKRKRALVDKNEDDVLHRQLPPIDAESEKFDVLLIDAPLVVRDARRPKQVSPLAGTNACS